MKAKPPFLCLKPGFDLALGKVLFTGVGTAPSSNFNMCFHYINFSVKISEKIPEENVIQGALASKPASTVFSAKLRHGLAWHPSSMLLKYNSVYKLFAQK